MTPEQIARQREIASALMGQGIDTSPVGHWTQGLARVANAAAGAYRNHRADKAEAANAEGSQSRIAALLGGMTGGGAAQFPSAPSGTGGAPVAAATLPQSAEAGAIRQGLIDRGLPEHVADAFVLNFQDESGLNPGVNEKAPLVPGSRGGYGLYQLTGPRRVAYERFAQQRGVDPSDTDTQLDFLMSELQGPEAKAAQSILSAPDTGTAAAAIVNNFLRPAPEHRASRANRYLAMGGGQTVDQPVQVASNDPSIGMAAPATQPEDGGFQVGGPASTSDAGNRVVQALINPQPMTGGSPLPMQGQMQAPQQVAQASQGMNPGMQAAITQALSNPSASPAEKQIATLLLQHQMQQSDPRGQLEMQIMQEKLNQMRNPQPQPTDTMRNLEWRAQQAGLQPGTPEYSSFMQTGGAVPQTQVNVGAGEKAWDQESAKLFAKRYDDLSAAAGNAQQMMGMYDLAEGAMNSGVRTGLGGDAELTLRQMGAALGLDTDPEKLAGGELIRAVQNRMALTMRSPDGGMGMPGALSDRDIKFLKDSQIGIDRSPEGNRKMLAAFRAMEQRKIDIAQLADQYVQENGRLDSGFNKAVRDYAAANPLFPDAPDGKAGRPITEMSDEELEAIINGNR